MAAHDSYISTSSDGGQLHPYSCLACRRRKRKCDRTFPCQDCQKRGLECIFTARKTPTRNPEGSAAQQKLAEMEAVVRSLRSQIDAASSSQISNDLLPKELSTQETAIADTQPQRSPDEPSNSSAAVEHEFGRLAIGQGRSRYVASHSWASIKDQVCRISKD